MKLCYMYIVHIVPSVSTLLSYTTLDIRLNHSHANPLVGVAVVYGVLNCYVTHSTGKPVYDFLDWQDFRSPVIYCLLVSTFYVCYFGLAKLSFAVKPPPAWIYKTRTD